MQIDEDDWVSSDRVDPLQSYTCLLKLPIHPSNPDYDFDRELQAISTHLKSMAKPHGDIDQVVKNILSGSSEVENCNVSQALKGKHVYVSANEVENPEWRPGLGRKRARFSMKPDSSQPSVLLEPTFNTKKYKDPEEYFKAYERYENARREIDKQMGTALASDQQNPSSFTRPRRQGLKRQSVKTKHLFSSVTYEIGENHISSQDTLEPSIPFNQSSQTKSDKIDPEEEMDLTGYKSDGFMDELLSLPTEDLEGDGAECLLRERLQIKSFQPEDLPEFLDFTLINQKYSKRTLPKPRSLKPRQGAEESSVDRSQSGVIVQEQDAVEKSNDAPSKSDQSHSASVEEHLRDGLSRNPEISPDRNNETTEEPGVPLKEPTKANSPPRKKQKSKKNSRSQSLTDQGTSWENVANSADKTVEQSYNAPCQSDQSPSASVDERLRDGLSRNPEISTDWHNETTEEPGVPLNEPTKANSPPHKKQKRKKNSRRQSLRDQGTSLENVANSADKTVEQSYNAPSQSDHSPSASVDERLRDGLSRNPEIRTDWHNETTEEPGLPLNEPTKANSPPRKKQKSKKNSRRQNLTDQRTSLENVANSADKKVEQSDNAPSQSDQSPLASVDERLRDGLSRNPEISTDWHNETTEEPGVPLNEPTKANSPPHKKQKSKKNSRRQSLRGTSLENVANSADKTVEQSYNAPSQSDQSPLASVDERLRDGLSRNPEICTDWHNETTEEPGVPLNEPTKANSPPRKKQKSKKNSRRQSLADQGASWETGVRRSTRFKTRPLEFWRGERLLYARIHKSLPTVIGMKYTPVDGEGGALEVKSLVDEKYKDLVEFASLH